MTTTARELAEKLIERANDSRDPLFWKPALITELTLTIERAELRGEQRGRESVLSEVEKLGPETFPERKSNDFSTHAFFWCIEFHKYIIAKLKEPT